MAVTNTTVLAADLQTYLASQLLVTAEKDTVFRNLGMLEPIPAGSSKTISFTQYTKMAQTSSLLTEGVTPSDTALATTAITATVDQLGAYVTLTDLAELTVKHSARQETTKLLADQAVESIDTIIANVLLAGTAVQYAGGAASRAALIAANVVTTTEFQKALRLLRNNGARPFDDGNYVMVVDPSVEQDILSDTKFIQASAYSQVQRQNQAEIGTWFGIRVLRSNNLATVTAGSGGSLTGHTSLVIGRGAFATSDLQSLQTFAEGPGSNSDPLHQRSTLGWKVAFKSVILNNSFMVRIESISNF